MSAKDVAKKLASRVEPEVVSTRKTFDGVTVRLHADGSISDRRAYVSRAKLPKEVMWRVWGDIETYTHAELPQLLRDVKAGRFQSVIIRKGLTEEQHQKILDEQKKHRKMDWHSGVLMPVDLIPRRW